MSCVAQIHCTAAITWEKSTVRSKKNVRLCDRKQGQFWHVIAANLATWAGCHSPSPSARDIESYPFVFSNAHKVSSKNILENYLWIVIWTSCKHFNAGSGSVCPKLATDVTKECCRCWAGFLWSTFSDTFSFYPSTLSASPCAGTDNLCLSIHKWYWSVLTVFQSSQWQWEHTILTKYIFWPLVVVAILKLLWINKNRVKFCEALPYPTTSASMWDMSAWKHTVHNP